MAVFRSVFVTVVLATSSVNVQAICPIGEGLSIQNSPDATPSYHRSHEPIAYRSAGEMDDGTIVLHAVDGRGSASESHELLLVRPAPKLDSGGGENLHPVTLGGEEYVIEKMESVTVDQPCDATVSVEGDEVILTIAAP